MFRRFRRGRRGKSQDGRGNNNHGTINGSNATADTETPEKSPTTPPPIKTGRRRLRGTPATTSPSSDICTSSPRGGKALLVVTPDMQSANLLDDMQVQLHAEAPDLPEMRSPSPVRPWSIRGVNHNHNYNSGSNNRRGSSAKPASRNKTKSLDEEAAMDSGCLPKTRNSEKTMSAPGEIHHQALQTEEEAEVWNRITKEAAAWDKKGTEHFENGDYDQAFLCYEKALTLKRQTLKPKHTEDADSNEASLMASVATSINNMTYLRQRAGQATADETMAAYLQSLQMKREILGPHHLSVGKTLNNIGSVFYLQRDYEPALKAYLQAFAIMEQQLGASHLDVGTVLSNVGDVYFAMRHKEEAKDHYRKALDVRWGALGPSDPKVVRLMEQLAFLETGRQPSRDEEDLSDSENEEFAVEDRLRHERFQEEVRILHDELAEDMKFFDLLERKMAIDMVRDKTRMFRKMKQLTDLSMDELMDVDVSENTENEDCDSVIATSAAPPPASLLESPAARQRLQDMTIDDTVERDSGTFFPDVLNTSTGSSSSATNFLDRNAGVMTIEERREALQVVRDRLATLRAAREVRENGQEYATANLQQATGWATQQEELQAN
uniref:Kinesin light chain n=1 Tax=Amphora coffeiformis TaxID=265554 RepID=A0A7S3KYE7_9STRA